MQLLTLAISRHTPTDARTWVTWLDRLIIPVSSTSRPSKIMNSDLSKNISSTAKWFPLKSRMTMCGDFGWTIWVITGGTNCLHDSKGNCISRNMGQDFLAVIFSLVRWCVWYFKNGSMNVLSNHSLVFTCRSLYVLSKSVTIAEKAQLSQCNWPFTQV